MAGNFKNADQEWQLQGKHELVKGHDFSNPELGKAYPPYGVYDQGVNVGWVNVGTDHDAAEFAMESNRCWWHKMECSRYPDAAKLLITADCGGNKGYRSLVGGRATKAC